MLTMTRTQNRETQYLGFWFFVIFVVINVNRIFLPFRGNMGDNLGLEALSVVHNPPEPAPAYPGKFWHNNKKGESMTKEQWIQELVFH